MHILNLILSKVIWAMNFFSHLKCKWVFILLEQVRAFPTIVSQMMSARGTAGRHLMSENDKNKNINKSEIMAPYPNSALRYVLTQILIIIHSTDWWGGDDCEAEILRSVRISWNTFTSRPCIRSFTRKIFFSPSFYSSSLPPHPFLHWLPPHHNISSVLKAVFRLIKCVF